MSWRALGTALLALALAACVSTRDDWGVPYDHAALAHIAAGTPRAEVLARLGGLPRGEFVLPEGGSAISFGYGGARSADGGPADVQALLEFDEQGRYVGALFLAPELEGAVRSPTDLHALTERHGPLQAVPPTED